MWCFRNVNRPMPAVAALPALGVTTLMGQNPPPPPDWRDWIKQGAEAFRYAGYAEAVSAFQKGSDANPTSPVPHIYIALGWFQQYIPNAVSAENDACARRAEREFRRALDLDPTNWIAVVMLGKLATNESRLDEAREWYRRALAIEPWNADIWCTLGTIAWLQWLQQGKPARQPMLDAAIAAFEKSIALDPLHAVAMEYLGLVLREGRQDLAASGQWMEKSADARSENVQAAIVAQNMTRPADMANADRILNDWAATAVKPLPPLPPPPPPPPPRPPDRGNSGSASGRSAGRGVIRFEPIVRTADQPAPIRVAPAVQARKLIARVDPEYAAGAPAEPMRFVVVIGKDGHIMGETLIDANRRLVRTAREALRQWIYQPTLVDGKQVEVVTEVRVEFKPAQ
jgi:tetratricopeptide (TPR) repeat protein